MDQENRPKEIIDDDREDGITPGEHEHHKESCRYSVFIFSGLQYFEIMMHHKRKPCYRYDPGKMLGIVYENSATLVSKTEKQRIFIFNPKACQQDKKTNSRKANVQDEFKIH